MTDQAYKRVHWNVACTKQSISKAQIGRSRKSKSFDVQLDDNLTKWQIELSLNGCKPTSRRHLSVFLIMRSASCLQFNLKFKFGILGVEDGLEVEDCKSGLDFDKTGVLGWPKFISHRELFEREQSCLRNGNLQIVCELTITKNASDTMINGLNSTLLDYKKMFLSGEFSDMEIITSDQKVLKVHKFVVAARSDVFKAMLTSDMQEAAKESVSIKDFDSDVITELLRYMYYKEVEQLPKVAYSLIYAADKYDIEKLKKICIKHIRLNLTAETLVRTLVISDLIKGAEMLFDDCISFMLSNRLTLDVQETEELSKEFFTKVLNQILARSFDTLHI